MLDKKQIKKALPKIKKGLKVNCSDCKGKYGYVAISIIKCRNKTFIFSDFLNKLLKNVAIRLEKCRN